LLSSATELMYFDKEAPNFEQNSSFYTHSDRKSATDVGCFDTGVSIEATSATVRAN
jgi:hypothetical protein